jgi:hypothetical protein
MIEDLENDLNTKESKMEAAKYREELLDRLKYLK